MAICTECLSRDTVRWGYYAGEQKWHCNNCGLTTIRPLKRMPKQRTEPRKTKREGESLSGAGS